MTITPWFFDQKYEDFRALKKTKTHERAQYLKEETMIVTSILAKNSENFEIQMFASIFSARGVLYAMSKSKTHNCGCNNVT